MNLRKKPVYLYDSDPEKKKSSRQPFWKRSKAPEQQESSPALQEDAAAITGSPDSTPDSTPNSTPNGTPTTEKAVKERKEKRPPKEKPPKAQKERTPKQPGRFRPSKRGVWGGISIVCALLVAFVLSPLVTRMANEETAEVLRAKQMIPKGSQLEATLFDAVEVPARGISKNTVSPSESIAGKYAAVDIPAEDMLLTTKVSDRIPFPDENLYMLPEGKQAMSVRIRSFENGLSGKLQKDDVVSVYASLKNEKEDYLAVAPPELRYVCVLSVTTETGADYTIRVTATDELSGVASITLPDGSVIPGDTADFKAPASGDYIFIATDNVGNAGEYIVSVVLRSGGSGNTGGGGDSDDEEGMSRHDQSPSNPQPQPPLPGKPVPAPTPSPVPVHPGNPGIVAPGQGEQQPEGPGTEQSGSEAGTDQPEPETQPPGKADPQPPAAAPGDGGRDPDDAYRSTVQLHVVLSFAQCIFSFLSLFAVIFFWRKQKQEKEKRLALEKEYNETAREYNELIDLVEKLSGTQPDAAQEVRAEETL